MAQYVYGKNVVMQMLKNQSEIQRLYLVAGSKNPEIEKEAEKNAKNGIIDAKVINAKTVDTKDNK